MAKKNKNKTEKKFNFSDAKPTFQNSKTNKRNRHGEKFLSAAIARAPV